MENPRLTKESNAMENFKVLFDCIDADAHGVGFGCFFTGRDVIGRKLELQVTNSHSIACKLVKTPQATKKVRLKLTHRYICASRLQKATCSGGRSRTAQAVDQPSGLSREASRR